MTKQQIKQELLNAIPETDEIVFIENEDTADNQIRIDLGASSPWVASYYEFDYPWINDSLVDCADRFDLYFEWENTCVLSLHI